MLRNPLKWRYLLHYWRGRVHSTQHKKQKFFCIQALFTLANLLMPKQLPAMMLSTLARHYHYIFREGEN